jgi:TIR domain
VLEDAGHRVVMQAWDFGPGSHFVAEMHRATRQAARTVAVVSAAYQASVFAAEEWQAAWAPIRTAAGGGCWRCASRTARGRGCCGRSCR